MWQLAAANLRELEQGSKIKTLAVREAVASDPDPVFDLLLQTLLVQLVQDGNSYALPPPFHQT